MAIYAIGDLHLSFNENKPMNIFGENWQNHEEKIHCLGDAGSNAELGVHERMSIDSGRGRTSCGTDYRNQ